MTITGAVSTNVSAAQQAVIDAESLATTYSAMTSLPTLSNTATSLDVSGLTGNYGANEFVYSMTGDIGAGATTNGGVGLTINGNANQYVIINVDKGLSTNVNIAGGVALTGGITSDHVLFNIDTTGSFQATGKGHGSTVNANIIDDYGATNLDNFTLDGRLFCTSAASGATGGTGTGSPVGNCGFVSNAVLNDPPAPTAPTPEPASVWMGFGGIALVAVGVILKRRPRA
jgi:hypothetical protein